MTELTLEERLALASLLHARLATDDTDPDRELWQSALLKIEGGYSVR